MRAVGGRGCIAVEGGLQRADPGLMDDDTVDDAHVALSKVRELFDHDLGVDRPAVLVDQHCSVMSAGILLLAGVEGFLLAGVEGARYP